MQGLFLLLCAVLVVDAAYSPNICSKPCTERKRLCQATTMKTPSCLTKKGSQPTFKCSSASTLDNCLTTWARQCHPMTSLACTIINGCCDCMCNMEKTSQSKVQHKNSATITHRRFPGKRW
uniref:Putative secreted peptide n=1 Tax=Rhipicephalus pulchellus TaxID=72859 RepID=L7MC59_RHIPC